MRPLFPITAIALAGAMPALAQDDVSAMIASGGLVATEAHLAALAEPSPSELFALGGVRFLSAIETALQTRYTHAVNDRLVQDSGLPFLRLPIFANPAPEPFRAELVEELFARALGDLAGVHDALGPITADDDVGVTINTADIWFDINANGRRDNGENLLDIAGELLFAGWGEPVGSITIRFDTADAAWLSAYAHLLSGISEVVLALGPTEAIDRVITARSAMHDLAPIIPDPDEWFFSMSDFADGADMIAMFAHALQGQPDVERSRAAHAHFLAMIADNREFWTRVAAETDNENEWIPNKNQQSALPLDFPPDTGTLWLRVLSDAEAILKGDQLIPYWRLGDGAGINLGRMMQDPPPLDLIGLIQGETLVPFMERGRLADSNSMMMFDQMMMGEAGLFMIILN